MEINMGIMDNEKGFIEENNIVRGNLVKSVLEQVNKRFHGYYAEDEDEALSILLDLVSEFRNSITNPEGEVKKKLSIGIGDSLSVHQIKAFDQLYELKRTGEIEINNPFERLEDGRFSEFAGQPNDWIPKETYDLLHRRVWEKARQALISDVFITGANALTKDGKIVSTDGAGNRISAVLYGPYKVVLIIGRNKIVNSTDEAFERIKNVAAPLNHYRHYSKHKIKGEKAEKNYGIYKFAELPCVKKGYCVDCGAPLCTRHASIVVERDTGGIFTNRIHVILVNRDLGC